MWRSLWASICTSKVWFHCAWGWASIVIYKIPIVTFAIKYEPVSANLFTNWATIQMKTCDAFASNSISLKFLGNITQKTNNGILLYNWNGTSSYVMANSISLLISRSASTFLPNEVYLVSYIAFLTATRRVCITIIKTQTSANSCATILRRDQSVLTTLTGPNIAN